MLIGMDTNVFVTAKITDGLFLIDTDSLKQLQNLAFLISINMPTINRYTIFVSAYPEIIFHGYGFS